MSVGVAPQGGLQDLMSTRLQPNAGKYEKTIYYRTPQRTLPTAAHPQGRVHPQAGWITVGGNNDTTMLSMLRRGFEQLPGFGSIRAKPSDTAPDGPFDLYGRWGPILCHPQGPAQFPLSQILAYGWFHPERVPVPGIAFPALRGEKVVEFTCPECEHRRFLRANHLARHLKNSHDYDRTELIALSREMGINFSQDLTGGKIETTFEFSADEPEPEPEPEPEYEVQTERPRGRQRVNA